MAHPLSYNLYNAAATVTGRHLTDQECVTLADELPAWGFYGGRLHSMLEHDSAFRNAVNIIIRGEK